MLVRVNRTTDSVIHRQDTTPVAQGVFILSFTPIPHRIESLVQEAISLAQEAGALPKNDHIQLPAVKASKVGDYASAVAMANAKTLKMKPLDIANTIAAHLPDHALIDKYEVAAPGFINFFLSRQWVLQQIERIISAEDTIFNQDIGQGRRLMVEFVSANPTGPLHIGRSRGAVVGDAIARLMSACGWDVHREYYFNNGGRQMELLGRSMQARYLQALGQDATVPDDGYQGDYLIEMGKALAEAVGDTWQDKDWSAFKLHAEQEIFKIIEATLERLGIRFDLFFNELDLYESNAVFEARDQLVAAGHTYESTVREGADEEEIERAQKKGAEPALWFRSSTFGDREDRVIVRSTGDPTYVLPDIAYHMNKLNRGFDRVINVLGADHFTESQVVKYGLEALGYDSSKVDVVLHQMVFILKHGESVTGSTRKGDIIPLDDIMDETGPDAVRYFLLQRSTDNDITFDLDLAVKQSNENPVFYIQNAHVRCAGIIRQLEERGYAADWDEGADLSLLEDEEYNFVLKMLELPEQLLLAHEGIAPHLLAFWALELARAFHPMYDRVRVLHSDVPEDLAKARMRLYRAAKVIFKRALHLIGMQAPERM